MDIQIKNDLPQIKLILKENNTIEYFNIKDSSWNEVQIDEELILENNSVCRSLFKGAVLYVKKTKEGKLKLYFFFNEVFNKGGSANVYSGYEIKENLTKLKEKVLKSPLKGGNISGEMRSLNRLYGDDKKLNYIQKRFKCLRFKNETILITKKYDGDLVSILSNLNFSQKFQCFKQMVLGVDLIIKRGFIALDIKLPNTLYKKDKEGNVKVVLCDINPESRKDILKKIRRQEIKQSGPAQYTTATHLTISDLTKLSTYVSKCFLLQKKTVQNKENMAPKTPVSTQNAYMEKYFKTAKKMMVYQLGASLFYILTGAHLVNGKELCHLNNSPLRASFLGNEAIEKKVKNAFKKLEEREDYASLSGPLEQIKNLLLKTLKVTDKARIDINEVMKETFVIEKTLDEGGKEITGIENQKIPFIEKKLNENRKRKIENYWNVLEIDNETKQLKMTAEELVVFAGTALC